MGWVGLAIIIFLLIYKTWLMDFTFKFLIPSAFLIAVVIVAIGIIVWCLGFFFNIPRGRPKAKQKKI